MVADTVERMVIEDDEGRSIPKAVFIEDVAGFVEKAGVPAHKVVDSLQNLYKKYQMMQETVSVQRMSLKTKIPDIKQALDMVKRVKTAKDQEDEEKRNMDVRFQLADNVYINAEVPADDAVCLWLGANVMMEYKLDEAYDLLSKNLATAQESLDAVTEDVHHLRDQITTVEVNIARVHNHNVELRATEREAEKQKSIAANWFYLKFFSLT